jgi:hypothetical protein
MRSFAEFRDTLSGSYKAYELGRISILVRVSGLICAASNHGFVEIKKFLETIDLTGYEPFHDKIIL